MRTTPSDRVGTQRRPFYREDEYLALSGIEHFEYCSRQWALIHIEGLWEENVDTTEGELFHKRAHLEGYTCDHGVVAVRSMRLTSSRLGIWGLSDIVEFVASEGVGVDAFGNGTLYSIQPVEYKKGRPKVGLCDKLQLTAQAMCLEEMYGVGVPRGFMFYGATRHRIVVEIDDGLRDRVVNAFDKMHELMRKGLTPSPDVGRHCARCSLTTECAPEIAGKSAVKYWKDVEIEWEDR